jgi:ankyrin repeat domain-containing protein 50
VPSWSNQCPAMADPLSVAGSVVGIISLGITVTQGLVNFYTTARDQKSNTAYTAGKLARLLDLLEILHKQLADRTFRPDERDLLDNIERSIRACDEFVRELEAENNKFKGGSCHNVTAAALTATRRVTYPFRQSTLQKLDEDVDETVSHLKLALQVLQQADIGSIQDDIEDTKSLLQLVRADQVSSAIRDSLRAPDASVEYNSACKKRHPGTGLWLVKASSFSSWLEKPNSFLWLYGFAGCGKSVLCSTAIQYAFRHRRSNPRIGIAFFFFVFDNESKQDVSAMLRALILQLSSQRKDSHGLVSRLHDTYRNTTPPDHALFDCLHQLIRMFDHVYVLLDALDESPRDKHRGNVLQGLVDLRAWSEPGLHLLVTSRDEPDIRDMLCNELGASIDEAVSMKNESVDRDIAAFVSQHLKDNRKLRKWKNHHDRIEAAFAERAKGVCVLHSSPTRSSLTWLQISVGRMPIQRTRAMPQKRSSPRPMPRLAASIARRDLRAYAPKN